MARRTSKPPTPVTRAPGTPKTEDNTPAPAIDPDPIDDRGKADPAKSATGNPSGAAPMNAEPAPKAR